MLNTGSAVVWRAILTSMSCTPNSKALHGRVAVVAGATRGAGRGIAAALGEAGATVVCTGRSAMSGNENSDYDRPETIEETAALVDELGGEGVAIQVDHLDAGQVRPSPTGFAATTAPSTSWSTTSGEPRSSRVHPRRGTSRSGSTIWTTACGS